MAADSLSAAHWSRTFTALRGEGGRGSETGYGAPLGAAIAVFGRRIGPDGSDGLDEPDGLDGVSAGSPGARGGAAVVAGARITKHAGPAFRWLACGAVGLPVVFT